MARRDTEGEVKLSLLDRLIDQDPKSRAEATPSRSQTLRELKASLKRDIEWLLNTRRYEELVLKDSHELPQSLVGYGLPDICSVATHSASDQKQLLWKMEAALTNFEPRLESVKISLEPVGQGARMLRFVIEGYLRVDPVPEHISFDTLLELTSGEYQVRGDDHAR